MFAPGGIRTRHNVDLNGKYGVEWSGVECGEWRVASGEYSRVGAGLVRLVRVRGLRGARAAPVEGLRARRARHAPPPPPAPPHASRRAPPRASSSHYSTLRGGLRRHFKYEHSLHVLRPSRFLPLVLGPILSIGEAWRPSTA